jgi:ribosomal protein L7/L12
MANKEELLDAIGNMTVLELAEFVEAFKEKFGVTAVMAAPAAGGAGAAQLRLRPSRRRRSSTSSSRRPAPRRSRSSRSCAS